MKLTIGNVNLDGKEFKGYVVTLHQKCVFKLLDAEVCLEDTEPVIVYDADMNFVKVVDLCKVKLSPIVEEQANPQDKKVCSKCGAVLLESGDCPACDYEEGFWDEPAKIDVATKYASQLPAMEQAWKNPISRSMLAGQFETACQGKSPYTLSLWNKEKFEIMKSESIITFLEFMESNGVGMGMSTM